MEIRVCEKIRLTVSYVEVKSREHFFWLFVVQIVENNSKKSMNSAKARQFFPSRFFY